MAYHNYYHSRTWVIALQELAPGAGFRSEDSTWENLEWLSDDITQPTEEAFNTKLAEVRARSEYDESTLPEHMR